MNADLDIVAIDIVILSSVATTMIGQHIRFCQTFAALDWLSHALPVTMAREDLAGVWDARCWEIVEGDDWG